MLVPPTAPGDYRAALEGAAYLDEGAAGRIFMRGLDRAALLQRLSTNDIERLRPGEGARTVLTTPIGRIIDLLTVHVLDEALLLVTSPEQGPPVYGHLRRNIFFNDQVTLEAAGRSHGQLALYGPAAAELLARLGAAGEEGEGRLRDLALHHTLAVRVAGAAVLLAARPPIGGQGFTLYVPAEALETVRGVLEGAGAVPLGAASLDVLRVERGYGAFGRELSQEYIPLETGLLDAVSFTKGCYVGQEIIARMESRGRLAKRLMGLRLSAEYRGLSAESRSRGTSALAKLLVGGKDAGDLTSAVVSPRLGPIGLAYVRTAHAEPGTVVDVAGGEVTGTVVELPFV
ncbi:MAG TPA: glycine cleavage T C-terminal barrel domain-containing protein [Roseiflexaceae bacterium]|nr:glycine cleavage T C-terminal barrel domain-containing protein [Roseiflexaceae bacterium]